jgi:hypothetical protein
MDPNNPWSDQPDPHGGTIPIITGPPPPAAFTYTQDDLEQFFTQKLATTYPDGVPPVDWQTRLPAPPPAPTTSFSASPSRQYNFIPEPPPFDGRRDQYESFRHLVINWVNGNPNIQTDSDRIHGTLALLRSGEAEIFAQNFMDDYSDDLAAGRGTWKEFNELGLRDAYIRDT